VTHLSASDSFTIMAFYKFIYLLTYLLIQRLMYPFKFDKYSHGTQLFVSTLKLTLFNIKSVPIICHLCHELNISATYLCFVGAVHVYHLRGVVDATPRHGYVISQLYVLHQAGKYMQHTNPVTGSHANAMVRPGPVTRCGLGDDFNFQHTCHLHHNIRTSSKV